MPSSSFLANISLSSEEMLSKVHRRSGSGQASNISPAFKLGDSNCVDTALVNDNALRTHFTRVSRTQSQTLERGDQGDSPDLHR